MYRTILFISLIVLLATAGCQVSGIAAEMSVEGVAVVNETGWSDLPADLDVPEILPDTIDDQLLRKGWIALYNKQDPVALWDGMTISGQQLAQYVIDHNIVITWNTNSERPHSSWVDRGASGNIYITVDIKEQQDGQLTRLVATLAHELFHRTMPFDQLEDTLYEEYWAFYVGAHVSGKGQASFFYTNPLSTDGLNQWFTTNNRSGYIEIHPAYPANVNPVN